MFGRSAAGDAAWDEASTKRDEERVRRGFWPKAKRVAAKLPFAEDLLAAYYAAFDRATPLQVKAALIGALAYFVLPADLVPDFILALGFVDDAAVIMAAVNAIGANLKPAHRERAREVLANAKGGIIEGEATEVEA
jgi:uncharacterized membrane protein YkvA (DUF1232 family)